LQTTIAPVPAPHQIKGAPGVAPWPVIAALILPAVAIYFLFVIFPIAQSVRYSGYSWNGLEPMTRWVGLDNFRQALAHTDFRQAMTHNFIIAALSVVFQLPFALLLALILNQRLRLRGLLRTMYFAPFVLSEVVTGVVWRQILRPSGLVDQVLQGAGFEGVIRPWLGDPKVVLYSLFFVISWKYFGLHMMLLLAGLQQIPDELEEAAAIDGASTWQTRRYVTLPLLGSTIRISVFLMIIGSLQLFDLVWVTTGGGPIGASSTMATYLYDYGFRRNRFGYASAVSIIIFALSMLVALLYQRFVLRRDLEGATTG
jgi:raffinose/stachyose/melibiose transport system permease protein